MPTNYDAMFNNALRDNDVDSALHAKKALIASLLNEIAVGQKNDPSGTPVSPYMHGAGGLLAQAGANPLIFSAMVQPINGMVTAMPRLDNAMPFPADYGGIDSPFWVTLTGQTEGDLDSTANQPAEVCDDPPVAGLLKRCIRTAQYGRFSARTPELNIQDIGRYFNQGETPDFNVQNNFRTPNPFVTDDMQMRGGSWINSEMQARMVRTGNAIQRMMAPLVYSGTPANDSAGGGYREFSGLNTFYTTSARDISGVLCPAANSFISNFNANVSGTNLQGRYLYQMLEDIYRYFMQLADDVGLSPVTWTLSMDRDLFQELTNIFPIQQYVRVIAAMDTVSTGDGRLNINGETANALRMDMWNGQYLPLAGQKVRVVTESPTTIGATYNAATNTRTSRIYFNPMMVMGNVPVTYWQFRNQANRFAQEAIAQTNGQVRATDNGKFLWTFNQRNGCISWNTYFEPRIMSHVPFLGGYIDNISYSPTVFSRDAFPTNSSFFYDGGVTSTPYEYGVTDWSNGSSIALSELGY